MAAGLKVYTWATDSTNPALYHHRDKRSGGIVGKRARTGPAASCRHIRGHGATDPHKAEARKAGFGKASVWRPRHDDNPVVPAFAAMKERLLANS